MEELLKTQVDYQSSDVNELSHQPSQIWNKEQMNLSASAAEMSLIARTPGQSSPVKLFLPLTIQPTSNRDCSLRTPITFHDTLNYQVPPSLGEPVVHPD
jgi:hypothetical protein